MACQTIIVSYDVVLVASAELRTQFFQVAGSNLTRVISGNLEQVPNLLWAQAKSASYLCGTGNE